jgi:hypothetical protein
MSIAGIRRRLRALEESSQWILLDKYPSLTRSEIAEIETRARRGEEPSRLELARERKSPIIDGELLMTSYRGRFSFKLYLGIDLGGCRYACNRNSIDASRRSRPWKGKS